MENKRRRSASQLAMFRSCPEKFRLIKLQRVGDQQSAAAIQGSAFHETAAAIELEDPNALRSPERYFLTQYDKLIEETEKKAPRSSWRVYGRGNDVDGDIQKRRETGLSQVESFMARRSADGWVIDTTPDGSPAVEVRFSLEFETFVIIGSIDRIESCGRVRDLKTGTREATPMQLGIYALAARELLGYDIWEGDFYYAKDDTMSETYDLSRFTKQYIERQFATMNRMVEMDLLIPSPGPDCFTCPVRYWCRELGKAKNV